MDVTGTGFPQAIASRVTKTTSSNFSQGKKGKAQSLINGGGSTPGHIGMVLSGKERNSYYHSLCLKYTSNVEQEYILSYLLLSAKANCSQ